MSYTVTIPYDDEWRALMWAKENCPSYITNTATPVGRDSYNIVFYFGQEKDATWFTLKWSNNV